MRVTRLVCRHSRADEADRARSQPEGSAVHQQSAEVSPEPQEEDKRRHFEKSDRCLLPSQSVLLQTLGEIKNFFYFSLLSISSEGAAT